MNPLQLCRTSQMCIVSNFRCFHSRVIVEKVLEDAEQLKRNVTCRKSRVNVDRVIQLAQEYESERVTDELLTLLKRLPNWTYHGVQDAEDPIVLEECGIKNIHSKRVVENAKNRGLLMQNNELTVLCGDRSYVTTGDLVRLERALISYTLRKLREKKFHLVSVPDIFLPDEVRGCGMEPFGQRSQIYKVGVRDSASTFCLSGTAEIALANLFKNKDIPPSNLPLKFCAVSRCFRAEVSTLKEEKGLYRVHQFNKVEMFGITEGRLEFSQELQKEFLEIEKSIFSELGLNFKVLDMPPHDLGNPAYRKIDIETWMNGHGFYGEISSTSDCTNYQSNRLGITSGGRLVHTVNGTACAVPRMLIALTESHSSPKNDLLVPEVLQPFMRVSQLRSEPAFPKFKNLSYYYFENRRSTLSAVQQNGSPNS